MGRSVLVRLAAIALLCAPLFAHAAGLGALKVMSPLGQPLLAEIEVVAVSAGEEDGLTARLAPVDAFRQAGIEFNPSLIGMVFEIVRHDGKTFVRLRSRTPVNEPFLEVLVELQWGTGRLVREYTFLLDPPEYTPAKAPAPMARPIPRAPAAVSAAPMAAPRAARAPRAKAAMAAPGGADSYKVVKGDTLSKIAHQYMPAGVTLNQMYIALFLANRDAFIRDNINLVRAGRILKIPDRADIEAVNASEARKQVLEHMASFAEYRRSVAAAAPAARASTASATSGRITPRDEAPSRAGTRDRLKLSRAEPGKPGGAAREDDRVSSKRALQEAQSRITDLEKNVTDLQKLLEIKNQQVAELEKRATAAPAAAASAKPAVAAAKPAAAVPAKPETAKPEAAKPEPAKPEAAKPEPAKPEAAKPEPAKPAPAKPEAAKPEPAKPEPAKPAAATPKPAPKAAPKPTPKPRPKPRPAPPPPPEPSLVDEFLGNPVALGGLGGVVLLLVGYGYWAWRRKKSAVSRMQDSVLGSSAAGAASVFSAPATPAAAEVSVAEPSEGAPSVGAAETDEVDPIAEADVYMAYGRDAQAEEILREALQKDKSRVPVHAKLLEIYAGRRDAAAFLASAKTFKALVGEGADWDKAAALGRSIDPENALYGGADAGPAVEVPAAPAAAAALDFDLDAEPGDATAEAPVAADAGQQEASPSIDFDLGGDASAEEQKTDFAPGGTLIMDGGTEAAAPAAPDAGLDFDLGDATQVNPASRAADRSQPSADETVAIDFDLNLDSGGGTTGAEPSEEATQAMDLSAISLDLDGPSGGSGDPKWQEVATKLDLAKAYEDMGDKDGARELLNEVMKEGDDAQKAQAQQMLGALG